LFGKEFISPDFNLTGILPSKSAAIVTITQWHKKIKSMHSSSKNQGEVYN